MGIGEVNEERRKLVSEEIREIESLFGSNKNWCEFFKALSNHLEAKKFEKHESSYLMVKLFQTNIASMDENTRIEYSKVLIGSMIEDIINVADYSKLEKGKNRNSSMYI